MTGSRAGGHLEHLIFSKGFIMKKLFTVILLASSVASVQALASSGETGRGKKQALLKAHAHATVKTNFSAAGQGRSKGGHDRQATVNFRSGLSAGIGGAGGMGMEGQASGGVSAGAGGIGGSMGGGIGGAF